MVMSGVPPPMVDALRRVRGCLSGTRLWTCCAGRAGTRMRSEALHLMLPSDPVPRFARERVPTKGAAKKLAFKRLENYPPVQ
jgi:hypothetical protein